VSNRFRETHKIAGMQRNMSGRRQIISMLDIPAEGETGRIQMVRRVKK
jgi:hypothetical protein